MKKIKMMLIALFVCALGYGSYSAYDYVTMSEDERFLLANIEALTWGEPGSGDSTITGNCNSSVVLVVDCEVHCSRCGRTWAVNPNIQKATPQYVSGSCTCGNTDWSQYNKI